MKTGNLAILGLAFLMLGVSACGVDPRKQAEAEAIRLRAESQAAAEQQALQIAQDLHEQQMEETKATEAERIAAQRRLIFSVSVTGAVALAVMIGASAYAYFRAAMSLQQAFAIYATRRAEVMANVIPLDKETGTFPLLMHRIGNGRYTLTNPNVGSVMLLDLRKAEDRQMIATAHNIQFAGVVARHARAKDAASLALINPPVIGANLPGLQVGLPVVGFMSQMFPAKSQKLSEKGDENDE